MQYKRFKNKYILRVDKGEEIVSILTGFCKDKKIKLGQVTGIGASDVVTIGLFDTKKKEYFSQEFRGDFELTSVVGNISTMKGDTYVHLHANISDRDQKAWGGHLNKAVVSATFEAVIDCIEGEVDREFSEEIGLNVYKL